jgi:hypothetical protein
VAPAQFVAAGGVTLMGIPRPPRATAGLGASADALAALSRSVNQTVLFSAAPVGPQGRRALGGVRFRALSVLALALLLHVAVYVAVMVGSWPGVAGDVPFPDPGAGGAGGFVAAAVSVPLPQATPPASLRLLRHGAAGSAAAGLVERVPATGALPGQAEGVPAALDAAPRALQAVAPAGDPSTWHLAPGTPPLQAVLVYTGSRTHMAIEFVVSMALDVGVLVAVGLSSATLCAALWVATGVRVMVAVALAPGFPVVLRGLVDVGLMLALARYRRTLDSCWVAAGAPRITF